MKLVCNYARSLRLHFYSVSGEASVTYLGYNGPRISVVFVLSPEVSGNEVLLYVGVIQYFWKAAAVTEP